MIPTHIVSTMLSYLSLENSFQFIVEMRILSKLRHPCITTVRKFLYTTLVSIFFTILCNIETDTMNMLAHFDLI
jgi:hypothetical protein